MAAPMVLGDGMVFELGGGSLFFLDGVSAGDVTIQSALDVAIDGRFTAGGVLTFGAGITGLVVSIANALDVQGLVVTAGAGEIRLFGVVSGAGGRIAALGTGIVGLPNDGQTINDCRIGEVCTQTVTERSITRGFVARSAEDRDILLALDPEIEEDEDDQFYSNSGNEELW